LKYWRLEPYVGFGSDAHSFNGRQRWQNAESAQAYVNGAAREYSEAGADEKFFVGLRLMAGVRPDAIEWKRYEEPIRRFVDGGLMETSGGMLRLTARGVMVSNDVFQEFLTA
jgi:oxygen-independent coproporphyrinogen-3 oxidase